MCLYIWLQRFDLQCVNITDLHTRRDFTPEEAILYSKRYKSWKSAMTD